MKSPAFLLLLLALVFGSSSKSAKAVSDTEKVLICHKNANGEGQTLSLSPKTAAAHLKNHDDTLGPCDNSNTDGKGNNGTGSKNDPPGTKDECVATPEACDGVDNDCDGQVDKNFHVGAKCSVGTGYCARSGSIICSEDGLTTLCDATPGEPAPETCGDWIDNDCNGLTDFEEFDVCPYKNVFVTSTTHDANFGSLSEADEICNRRAYEAGLPGTYKVWLDDGASGPADRFTQSAVPYRLTIGTLVANDYGDLVSNHEADQFLRSPINFNEFGGLQFGFVWTGLNPDATSTGINCNNWTGDYSGRKLSLGTYGDNTNKSASWTNRDTRDCNSELHLYCFEQ